MRYVWNGDTWVPAERESGGINIAVGAAGWPMKSEALAVHPTQIKEAMARNKRNGITGVSYCEKTGRAIIADRAARRALCKLEGVFDRAGGYGDASPGDSEARNLPDHKPQYINPYATE